MASAKYRNLFQYLKKKAYPEGFTKQKTTLRKFAKKFEYDSKLESLFYVAKEKEMAQCFDDSSLSPRRRKRGSLKSAMHSAPFSEHAGRDNTLTKMKERFNWPDYYKDSMEMVSYKFYLFANAPSRSWFLKCTR